ncbi:MAG: hypothetical protein ACRD2D_06315, partial [Terriglobales bacterium]
MRRLCIAFLGLAVVAAGQTVTGSFAQDLRDFLAQPAPYGYESALAGRIANELAPFSPQRDALGDLIVTVQPASAGQADTVPLLLATSL